jgi:hypothetical protein
VNAGGSPGVDRTLWWTLGLPRRTAIACVAITLLAFRIYAIVWPSAPLVMSDSRQYMEVAADIRTGHLELHDRSPGYPLILALTGSTDTGTRSLFYVSLFLHGLSVWLLLVLLHAAGLGERSLVLFATLAWLPLYAETAGYVLTETLAQCVLVAGLAAVVWFFSRWSALGLVAASLAFPASAIVRPVYGAVGGLLGVALTLWPYVFGYRDAHMRRALRTAGTGLLLGNLLIVGAFAWFNERRFGFFGIVPTLGFNLTTKTILFVEQLPQQYAAVREVLIRERAAEVVRRGGFHDGSQTVWNARPALTAATGLSTPKLSAYLVRADLELIRHAPVPYIRDVARSAGTYWLPADDLLADFHSAIARAAWLLVHSSVVALWWLQMVTLVGAIVFDLSRRISGGPFPRLLPQLSATPTAVTSYLVAGFLVLYTMVVTCLIDIGEPRQRRPTDLLIVFMCVLGVHVWRQTFFGSSMRRVGHPGGQGPVPAGLR